MSDDKQFDKQDQELGMSELVKNWAHRQQCNEWSEKVAQILAREILRLKALPSAMGDKDAERYRALKLVAPTIIHPCQPPLAQGGWHGRLRGAWGSTGIFASRIDVFADRVLAVLAEHPDSEADHDHSGYVQDKG